MSALLNLTINCNQLNGSLPEAWGSETAFSVLTYMNLVITWACRACRAFRSTYM